MKQGHLRAAVRLALSDVHFAQPGILGVQLDMMQLASSDRYSDKPTRTVTLGENAEITILAEPVQYHEGKKFKTSSAPITETDFALSSWRRAALSLPESELAWLLYSYANKIFSYDVQVEICTYVWTEFLRQHRQRGFKRMKAKTANVMRSLVFFSIQHGRRNALLNWSVSENNPLITNEEMSGLMGIGEKSWCEHYKKRWIIMMDVCRSLDERSLLMTKVARDESIKVNRSGYAELPVQTGVFQPAKATSTSILISQK
jgi:hypothetical protein